MKAVARPLIQVDLLDWFFSFRCSREPDLLNVLVETKPAWWEEFKSLMLNYSAPPWFRCLWLALFLLALANLRKHWHEAVLMLQLSHARIVQVFFFNCGRGSCRWVLVRKVLCHLVTSGNRTTCASRRSSPLWHEEFEGEVNLWAVNLLTNKTKPHLGEGVEMDDL